MLRMYKCGGFWRGASHDLTMRVHRDHLDLTSTIQSLSPHLRTAIKICEPVHEITNNVDCATSKASDQPAHMRSLIRAFASRLSIL